MNELFLREGLDAVRSAYGLPTIEPNASVAENKARVIKIFEVLKQGLSDGAGKPYGQGVRAIAENVGPRTPHFDRMLEQLSIGGFALAVLKINDPGFKELDLSNYHAGSIVGFTNHDYPVIETQLASLYAGSQPADRAMLRLYHRIAGLTGDLLPNSEANRRKLGLCVMGSLVREAAMRELDVVFVSGDIDGQNIEYNRPGIPACEEWKDKPGIKCWTAREMRDCCSMVHAREEFFRCAGWAIEHKELPLQEFHRQLHSQLGLTAAQRDVPRRPAAGLSR